MKEEIQTFFFLPLVLFVLLFVWAGSLPFFLLSPFLPATTSKKNVEKQKFFLFLFLSKKKRRKKLSEKKNPGKVCIYIYIYIYTFPGFFF